MSSTEWLQQAQEKASNLLDACHDGTHLYKKWYTFTYGKTNAEVAAATGLTEAQVARLTVIFTAMNEIGSDTLNSVQVSANDRLTLLADAS